MIKRLCRIFASDRSTVVRTLCGIILVGLTAGLLFGGLGIVAVPALVLTAVVLSRPLTALAVRPFHAWIDSIYLGSPDRSRPELTLRLARFYCSEGRWDDALAEYRKQLDWHPGEKAVLEEARQAARRSGDRELIDEWCGGRFPPFSMIA